MFIKPHIEKEYPKTEPLTGIISVENELKKKGFLIVMEEQNSYKGLLTISDVFDRRKKLVADCMSPKPSVHPNVTIHQALDIMHSGSLPAIPVIDENQQFWGVITVAKLKELFEYYEQERTKNFEEKLSLSRKIKEQFFRNLSHEIRTPLNAIQGLTELLLYSDIPEAEKESFATMLHNKTDELLMLIDSLLNLSRLQAGDFSFTSEDNVAPSVVCNEIKTKVFSLLEEYNKTNLEVKTSFNLPENFVLETNFNYLQEIIIHLLTNAIKFTDEGFIELGCFMNASENVIFFVTDTGIGIPEDCHSSIFNAFEKIELNKNRINPGLGLGLTLASKIIESSGGQIWLESEPGKGSTFYFHLGENNSN